MKKLPSQKKLKILWNQGNAISPALQKKSKKIILSALEHLPFSLSKTYKKYPTLELSIFIASKKQIKNINHAFRKKNKPTDVLSFARQSQFNKKVFSLGDIIICNAIAKAQAKTHKVSYETEFLNLLIHGFLHNWGYDHEISSKEAKKMFRLQELILLSLQ
jgi:probable rRNA maturation factor